MVGRMVVEVAYCWRPTEYRTHPAPFPETPENELRTGIEQVRVRLSLSRQNLKRQQDLWKEGLTTREAFERAQNEVEVLESLGSLPAASALPASGC